MDFYKNYCDLKVRVAPFRKEEDYEYIKTVSIIDALADRADVIHNGVKCGRRFGFEEQFDPDKLLQEALGYVRALEQGIFPLKGKYTEPGVAFVDHTFVEVNGEMHVFYNRAFVGYSWAERFVDTFGHAVSKDLINWKPLSPVFTAEKGGHDDYQVWSPGIIRHNDKYWMFYTGVNFNIAQAACLATSEDLVHWERHENNPIFIPGDWCPWSKDTWSDCRDGMVFKDDDGIFYMYYCTTKILPEGGFHNALGIASSEDLVKWKDLGCITIKNCDHAPESPYVMKRNGKYYLFFTNCGKGTAYATSDDPVEGWSVLEDDRNLLFPGCTSEVFEFKGEWYISNANYILDSGGQQYLEIYHFYWNDDGTFTVGRRLQ